MSDVLDPSQERYITHCFKSRAIEIRLAFVGKLGKA